MGRSTAASQVPTEKAESVKQLKQSTHVNMAACYLKLSENQKCVDACTKALSTGPSSKAFFRRGQAHLELRNLDEAKEDFLRARDLEPSDPAIDQWLKRLKTAYAQHDAREKKRFAKLFNKLSETAEEQSGDTAAPAAAASGAGEGAAAAEVAAAAAPASAASEAAAAEATVSASAAAPPAAAAAA